MGILLSLPGNYNVSRRIEALGIAGNANRHRTGQASLGHGLCKQGDVLTVMTV